MPDISKTPISNDTIAGAVRDTIELFFADHPELTRRQVEIGDYPWSTDGQLVGLIVDGERFTITVQRVDPQSGGEGAASC